MRCDASGVRAGAFPRIASAAPDGAGGTAAAGAAPAGSAARAPPASTTPAQGTICLQPVILLCVFGRGDVSSPPLDAAGSARDTRRALNVFSSHREIESPAPLLAVDRPKPTKEDP